MLTLGRGVVFVVLLLLCSVVACSYGGVGVQPSYVAKVDLWFGGDKVLHFGVSLTIGFGVYSMYFLATRNDVEAKCVSIVSVVLLGLVKECYDWKVKKHFSYKDLAWDIAGALTGTFLGEVSYKNNIIFAERGKIK